MVPGYGDSYTVWCSPTPGTRVWTFQMKDGYIDKRYVKMRYLANSVWYPVKLAARYFTGELEITLPFDLPACDLVEIYRDTPTGYPIVVYGNGGSVLTDETRNAAARQAMHVLVEFSDKALRSTLTQQCAILEAL